MGQPLQNTDRIRRGRRGKVFLDQCSYLFHVMQTANVANQFYDIAQVGAGFLENSLQVGNNQFALRLEVIWSKILPSASPAIWPAQKISLVAPSTTTECEYWLKG